MSCENHREDWGEATFKFMAKAIRTTPTHFFSRRTLLFAPLQYGFYDAAVKPFNGYKMLDLSKSEILTEFLPIVLAVSTLNHNISLQFNITNLVRLLKYPHYKLLKFHS